MRHNGIIPTVIRAGRTNMFLSKVFTNAFVNATGVPVELYECDGSVGAAIGAGIGEGFYLDAAEAFNRRKMIGMITPTQTYLYDELYIKWKSSLMQQLVNAI